MMALAHIRAFFSRHTCRDRRGFSLLEISIVLLILGFMVGLGSQTIKADATDCAAPTTAQVAAIKDSLQTYVRSKGIYPRPAGRGRGETSPQFGRSVATVGDSYIIRLNSGGYAANPILFGALPFQTLGLPSSFASDCWGNKFTYIVTENLTIDTTTFGTSTGNIVVKTGTTASPSTVMSTAAYAVISHGPNGISVGGVRRNYDTATGTTLNQGWCTAATASDTENCDVANNIIFMNAYNAGAGAGANYFDDFVGATIKPQSVTATVAVAPVPTTYCWGYDPYSQLGDSLTLNSPMPVKVTNHTTGLTLTKISTANHYACSIASNGIVYCWGNNRVSAANDGTIGQGYLGIANYTSAAAVPVINLPGGATFTDVRTGLSGACVLRDNGSVYCWGNVAILSNNTGGSAGAVLAASPPAAGGVIPAGSVFTQISVGGSNVLAVRNDGKMIGWGSAGYNLNGLTGVSGVPVSAPAGQTFTQAEVFQFTSCGLATNGNIYCWGGGGLGGLGDGTTTDRITSYAAVIGLPGGVTFTKIGKSGTANSSGGPITCGIGSDGKGYCWGGNSYGQVGDGTINASRNSATAVVLGAMPAGTTFTQITMGHYHACGLGSNNKVYCWGRNNFGQLGDGTFTDSSSPKEVDLQDMPTGNTIAEISAGGNQTCAITQ